MDKWFTVEEIDNDTYAISEYGHWEETHCYLLLGKERALLIDTGLGVGNIKAVVDGLTGLPVTAVTTHVHWDHIGGHRYFDKIAVHEDEEKWLAGGFPVPLQAVKSSLTLEPCDFPKGFKLDEYSIFQGKADTVFGDGDVFDLGGRRVEAVHTPGHSPGHCCFYEADGKYLYSGDLIYKGCLYAFYPTTDPVAFYNSIKRVGRMDIDRVLPGHHQLIIPTEIIGGIEKGFESIDCQGRLRQGEGVFDFGVFQIQI